MNVPFRVQYGVSLLQVLSALHVLVEFVDIVYPVLQLNEATDWLVVPAEYLNEPFSGLVRFPQSKVRNDCSCK